MASVEGVAVDARALPVRVWHRVGRRADGRAPLWLELAVIGWLFWLYDVINNAAPLRQLLARSNAIGVLSVERSLHLDPELALNHWLAGHATLGVITSYYYFFAHGVVTLAILIVLWWRNAPLYRRLRTQLVLVNLIAFAVFWRYPLAPPRMFAGRGFIDVIANSHSLLSWHSSALVDDADQLAAMPSLHVAWAMWCAIALWQLSRRRSVAVLAVAYPLATTFVVLATGNHYLLDVIAGAGTLALAVVLHRALELLRLRVRWVRLRAPAADTGVLAAVLDPVGLGLLASAEVYGAEGPSGVEAPAGPVRFAPPRHSDAQAEGVGEPAAS